MITDKNNIRKNKKKKHFSVFDDLTDKKSDNLEDKIKTYSAFSWMKEEKKLEYIPPYAFTALKEYPEYDYLRFGLYVGNELLKKDFIVDEAINQIKMDHKQNIGETLGHISWEDSKNITDAMGGKMMTPAEYMCIIKYLKETSTDPILKGDMTLHNAEWLDGVHFNDELYVHSKIISHDDVTDADKKKYKKFGPWWSTLYGGTSYNIAHLRKEIGGEILMDFSLEETDPRTGMPTRKVHVGDMLMMKSKNDNGKLRAISRSRGNPGRAETLPVLDFYTDSDVQGHNMGLRIAYISEAYARSLERKKAKSAAKEADI